MMKIFLFVCMVTLAAGANVELSKSQKDKVQKLTVECMKESGVKPEVLAQAKKGQFADDEGLKKFTLCFFQRTGILTPDAKLNVDAALAKLPPTANKDAVKKVLEQCKAKTGKTQADAAFEIFKCYQKATPSHVVF